jgi:hypothetical protein
VNEHFDEETGYRVTVNGKVYVIWTDDASIDWGASQVATTELLNDVLRSSGVAERAYGVNGGNDFFVMFLTRSSLGRSNRRLDTIPRGVRMSQNWSPNGTGNPTDQGSADKSR